MKERNQGIDLLRIVSMYFIVILHIITQGGILSFGRSQMSTFALYVISVCGVNCFGMISGYVGYREVDSTFKLRLKKYIMLWLQVFVYSFGLTLVLYIVKYPALDSSYLIKGLFPVTTSAYWYFSEYTALYFVMPYVNRLIRCLERTKLNRLAIICMIILPVYNQLTLIFTRNDLFFINRGYSFLWLLILYIIGAWIKVNDVLDKVKGIHALIIFAVSTLLMYISMMFAYDKLTLDFYCSPTVVLQAFSLVIIFAKLGKRIRYNRAVKLLAPAAFGVYLIHENPIVYKLYIHDKFSYVARYSPLSAALSIIGVSLLIFVISIAIDELRIIVFKLFRIESLLDKILIKSKSAKESDI